MEALGDRIIIEPVEQEKTDWGFILPDDAGDPIQTGVVVGVGKKFENEYLRPGAKILFKRPGGWEFNIDGRELLWIRHKFALAIIN